MYPLPTLDWENRPLKTPGQPKNQCLASGSKVFSGASELEAAEQNLGRYLRRKCGLVARLLEGDQIFEVGCGIGTFTRLLSEKGYKICASDISTECLDRARQRDIEATFVQLDICDVENPNRPLNRFDSVLILNVLEHTKKDNKALLNARSLLRNRGVLVVLVPAFKFLYSEFDRQIGHYRRYSKSELLKKISEAGFQIEYLRYWDLLGFFGWLVKCRLVRYSRVSQDLTNPIFDKIYDLWLKLEERMIFPFGVNLVLKARKAE